MARAPKKMDGLIWNIGGQMRRYATLPALSLVVLSLSSPLALSADLTLTIGGRVSVELVSSDAAFSNTLALVSPASAQVVASGCAVEGTAFAGTKLMSEKQAQHGCRVELDANSATPEIDPFPAGSVLRFSLCAQTDSNPSTCENVWSSDAGSNSDGFDHVRISSPPSAAPGRLYQLSWEDLPSGGDGDFNDLVAAVRVEGDADGDGLWDDWESTGIDTDGNGTIDLNLPALGANPLRKDLFIEIDFMDCAAAGSDCAAGDTHSHRPDTAAVAAVVQAFANAPVANPDGSTGITLHVDVGNAIAHQNFLNINGLCFAGGAGIGSFDAVKSDPANFGPNNPRRFSHRYALFTHQQAPGQTSSGCGELPGNDFQVSLGGWAGDIGTVQDQAGTLMHEFGHNLRLGHGGRDSVNFKPNYLSVMNYAFQINGLPPTDPDGAGPLARRIDFSRSALAALNENSLSEPAGIGGGPGSNDTFYFCPDSSARTGTGTGAIDWSCNCSAADAGVRVNINGDCNDLNSDGVCQLLELSFTTLNGFEDWNNLLYAFQSTGDFEDGQHRFSQRVVELDLPTQQRIQLPPEALSCFGVRATILGTNGNDALVGTAGDDVIVGMGGDDSIEGGSGNDVICGGDGDDVINPGSGNDQVDGGNGKDTIGASSGDDTLKGGAGNDRIDGGAGRDVLEGAAGDDNLIGGADDDLIDGGAGNDSAVGGSGNDTCTAVEVTTTCP